MWYGIVSGWLLACYHKGPKVAVTETVSQSLEYFLWPLPSLLGIWESVTSNPSQTFKNSNFISTTNCCVLDRFSGLQWRLAALGSLPPISARWGLSPAPGPALCQCAPWGQCPLLGRQHGSLCWWKCCDHLGDPDWVLSLRANRKMSQQIEGPGLCVASVSVFQVKNDFNMLTVILKKFCGLIFSHSK